MINLISHQDLPLLLRRQMDLLLIDQTIAVPQYQLLEQKKNSNASKKRLKEIGLIIVWLKKMGLRLLKLVNKIP